MPKRKMQRQKIKIIKNSSIGSHQKKKLFGEDCGRKKRRSTPFCVFINVKDENRFFSQKWSFFSATCFIYKNISTVNKEH